MTELNLTTAKRNCDGQPSLAPATGSAASPTLCACGCGNKVILKTAKYLRGHCNRGKKWSESVKKRMRDGWKKAMENPAMRARLLFSEARKKKHSEALKGHKTTNETRRKISLAHVGIPTTGRAAKDRPDHASAKHWIVRSPIGVIYEFDNATSWARKNEQLFRPDENSGSILPLWRRFVKGVQAQTRPRQAPTHWNGWTLVSITERESLGSPDLLARDKQPNISS